MGRVERMTVTLKPCNIDAGHDYTDEEKEKYRELGGLSFKDRRARLLGKRLGVPADMDTANVITLNHHAKKEYIEKVTQTIHDLLADDKAVRVILAVDVFYPGDNAKRPNKLHYKFVAIDRDGNETPYENDIES